MSDVTVIGAGPAGSIAALLLARAGRRVTLIEQHVFPRDKVCGECLSSLGIDVLTRTGLIDRIESAKPIRLTRSILHGPAGPSVTIPLPRPMLGLSRRVLDQILLDAAIDAGVDVKQPARCEKISANGRVQIRVRDLRDNRITTIESDHAIVADGKSHEPSRDFGIKAHFENIAGPRDAIELFGVDGHYGGLAPIENNLWNTAFSVPAERLHQSKGNLDAMFDSIIDENASLRRRFKTARRASDWLASPLPRFSVRNDWPPNVIPVGNAAAALEPIGGEGMGLAMASAEIVANSVLHSREHELTHRFRNLWDVRSKVCRAVAKILSSPSQADAALSLAEINPALVGATMRWIGK